MLFTEAESTLARAVGALTAGNPFLPERPSTRLMRFFEGSRAVDVDDAALTRYVAPRQVTVSRRGWLLANGTINREMSLLGTMFRLAARRQKVLHPPTITLLKEAAPPGRIL